MFLILKGTHIKSIIYNSSSHGTKKWIRLVKKSHSKLILVTESMHLLFNNRAEIFRFLKIIYVIINPTSCLMQYQLLTTVGI